MTVWSDVAWEIAFVFGSKERVFSKDETLNTMMLGMNGFVTRDLLEISRPEIFLGLDTLWGGGGRGRVFWVCGDMPCLGSLAGSSVT